MQSNLVKLVKKAPADVQDFLPSTLRIASLLSDHKALDVRAYDVRELTLIADSFVICSAGSEPQMRAMYNAVVDGMREVGNKPLHVEGTQAAGWIVVDFGTVILHLFRKEARTFYDLDGLWGDAPSIDLDLD
ncbi:MAG: hypothetical protein AMXMBFR84_45470 [Candidatus Hydrogenedentota bacterium]